MISYNTVVLIQTSRTNGEKEKEKEKENTIITTRTIQVKQRNKAEF